MKSHWSCLMQCLLTPGDPPYQPVQPDQVSPASGSYRHRLIQVQGFSWVIVGGAVCGFVPVPFPGQFGTTAHCFVPHDGEVGAAGKVLSDGDRRVQVQDHVPPSTCGHTGSLRQPQH